MNVPATSSTCLFGLFDLIDYREVEKEWGWLFTIGIVTMVLGVAALIFPALAALATELTVGWLLIMAALFQFVYAFRMRQWKGFMMYLLGAFLSFTTGILMLLYPWSGVLVLTLLVISMFIVTGIFRMVFAWRIRPAERWGWLFASGVLELLLAVFVVLYWPDISPWFIGMLVGIDLLFSGTCLTSFSLSLRRQAA